MSSYIKPILSKQEFISHKDVYKKMLSEAYFEVMKLRFEEEKSIREIAQHFEVSSSRIRQIINRSFKILKKDIIKKHSKCKA